MSREALLDQVSILAMEAVTAEQYLLSNALSAILLVSRLPYRLKQTMLNSIMDLLRPIVELHAKVPR